MNARWEFRPSNWSGHPGDAGRVDDMTVVRELALSATMPDDEVRIGEVDGFPAITIIDHERGRTWVYIRRF